MLRPIRVSLILAILDYDRVQSILARLRADIRRMLGGIVSLLFLQVLLPWLVLLRLYKQLVYLR